ncbi:IME2 [[Candida] subhashii]|uniref:IME2 n=1 Tax=[Candida] subhashii TaxID=561895 RepID=A0A8J5QWE6_9ASCO|nr:IME2 [[Candida] subhashii]KAG7663475.1 IME2 [[Candida] subhashii]
MIKRNSTPLDFDSPPKNLSVHSYKNKYQSVSSLGNGSFGTVELAKVKFHKLDLLKSHEIDKRGTMLFPNADSKHNLSNLVAIKTMKKRLPLLHDYANVKEVKFILAVPSHPCLVQIFEMFVDDIRFQLHISMEALNQNLYQLIRSRRNVLFSPVTLRSILSQLLCAIKHIHKFNYFHRDVKPENILVIPTTQFYHSRSLIPPYRKNDNFIIKLGDYGLARHVSNMRPYTAYVSTRWYRSPEILLRQKSYSRPIDIWAFGSVAAEIVNFAPLFPGVNEIDQIWKILRILGTPTAPESNSLNNNYIVPLGGYWSEAQVLAQKLGFGIPAELGLTIAEVLPNPHTEPLADVIRSCLLWDPLARPNAHEISKMPYFKDTITLMDSHIDNEIPMQASLNKLAGIPVGSSATIMSSKPNATTITTATTPQASSLPLTLSRSPSKKNSPNKKPLLPPPKLKDVSLSYDDLEMGAYENYFSGYVTQTEKNKSHEQDSSDIDKICHAWMNKENDLKLESPIKPRNNNNNDNHTTKSIIGNKRSFSTFSLENEEIINS